MGQNAHNLRREEASIDTAREEDILFDLDRNLPKFQIESPDIWVCLKPTNPFRDLQKGNEGIKKLISNPVLDSVRLVSEADLRLQQINENGFLEIITS